MPHDAMATGHSQPRPRSGDIDSEQASQLRHQLVGALCHDGTIRTPQIEAAMRAVPRHQFVPDVPLQAAYADDIVRVKTDTDQITISAASQPTIVALMLEQLGVRPGHHVLEIGAATGYNAALLGHLAGPTGHVTTIDIDDDLVHAARAHLATAGTGNVTVVCGDGALGHPPGGPYDRIEATVGAHRIPPAWLDQLSPHGRLVVPVRVHAEVSRAIAFERAPDGDGWISVASDMCGFMPLRGLNDDPQIPIQLDRDGQVTLITRRGDIPDPAVLSQALRISPIDIWTGVTFAPMESPEWMWLYLSCSIGTGLHRMNVQPAAVEHGLVRPQFPWGAMATTLGGSLAYLTMRRLDPHRDVEIGVIAHGDGAADLAELVADTVRGWHHGYRANTARFRLRTSQPTTPPSDPFRLQIQDQHLAVEWASDPTPRQL